MSFREIGLAKVLIKLVWISFPDIGQAPWKIWIPKNLFSRNRSTRKAEILENSWMSFPEFANRQNKK